MKKITIELVSKINRIFLIVVGSITVVYMLLLMTGNLETGETEDGLKVFSGSVVDYTSQLYVFTFIVLLIAIMAAFSFAIVQMFSDFRKLKSVFTKVLLPSLLVFIFAYFMANDTPIKFVSGNLSTEGESKWSEMGIIVFYVYFLIAVIIAFFGSLINKLVKK